MNVKLIAAGIAAGALLGVLCRAALSPPALVRQEEAETESVIASMDAAARRFEAETADHRTETERRVVVIREAIRREVLAYSPDGLADAARHEIELWRGSAGGSIDKGPPRLDGGGGGVFPER
jgi:hypothetical protein